MGPALVPESQRTQHPQDELGLLFGARLPKPSAPGAPLGWGRPAGTQLCHPCHHPWGSAGQHLVAAAPVCAHRARPRRPSAVLGRDSRLTREKTEDGSALGTGTRTSTWWPSPQGSVTGKGGLLPTVLGRSGGHGRPRPTFPSIWTKEVRWDGNIGKRARRGRRNGTGSAHPFPTPCQRAGSQALGLPPLESWPRF